MAAFGIDPMAAQRLPKSAKRRFKEIRFQRQCFFPNTDLAALPAPCRLRRSQAAPVTYNDKIFCGAFF